MHKVYIKVLQQKATQKDLWQRGFTQSFSLPNCKVKWEKSFVFGGQTIETYMTPVKTFLLPSFPGGL